MIPDNYRTIKQATEGPVYKERASKFYGFAFPVESQQQAKEILEGLWKKHASASHVCYAWRLGVKEARTKASDDGEPYNSAGAPILGQITAFELTYVLVAVVRYYGGKKLGVSGLIQAYKTSAREVLESALIVQTEIQDHFEVRFGYDQINRVNQIINKNSWEVISREMKEDCTYILGIRISESGSFEDQFHSLQGVVTKVVFKYSQKFE